ncbi:hypothetical protein [Thalassococcus arenae]|uniref:hypothetical protein n=1 Tax=Thalassococcus arenae TaxID=2851652 RepID=UPI0032AF703A
MIRPEAAAILHRWREALAGVAVLGLGLYWALFTRGPLLGWVGVAVVLCGAALLFVGWQRGRFRTGSGGPGIVQVVEGRITYFGPLSGGVADLESLDALRFDPTGRPGHWLLDQPGQPPLAIPVNAAGADQLFDLFAQLPGIRTETMVRARTNAGDHVIVIWQAPTARKRTARLH